jgi:threonine aldolase
MAAELTIKEAALFTPSGTMSNLVAVLAQTRAGDEIILGSEAHMLWYEVGGTASVGGVVMRTIANNSNGTISLDALKQTIRPESLHFPPTTLLCLENTHNRCEGAVLTEEYTRSACEIAHDKGLSVHLDGARIFNAAVALGVSAADLAKPADSVSFCLSKGLSAPVGSLLCGSTGFIAKARKIRKMLGGGMRQSGVLAAAGIVALEQGIERLADDHRRARQFAEGLAAIPGIQVDPNRVKTNIVAFEIGSYITTGEFIDQMTKMGVKFTQFGEHRVRAVTNRMVGDSDIPEALTRIQRFIRNQ